MTVATVTTDINIGPFKIPSNGQSMIMNNYAQRNNLAVELAIPEPLMSNHFATVLWLHEERNLSKNDETIKNFQIESNKNIKSNLYGTYDILLNDKYKIKINQNTLERVKNYFR